MTGLCPKCGVKLSDDDTLPCRLEYGVTCGIEDFRRQRDAATTAGDHGEALVLNDRIVRMKHRAAKPLTPKCQEMLDALNVTGECVRYTRGRGWNVAGRHFHTLTGDALVGRGLLEPITYEYDANHYDRFKVAIPPHHESRTVSS